MTEQEKKDLDSFKAATVEQKLKTFDYLKMLSSMSNESLNQAGYCDGMAEAILSALRDGIKKIDRLMKDHLKKYPD